MSSKFWAAENESSSSESSSESEHSDSEQEKDVNDNNNQKNDNDDDDDDDEEDVQRVVRTAKEKAIMNLQKLSAELIGGFTQATDSTGAALNPVGDWTLVQDKFKEINKGLERYLKDANTKQVPNVYLLCMKTLNNTINDLLTNDKEKVKSMNKTQYTAFMSLSRRMKAHLSPYQSAIDNLKEEEVAVTANTSAAIAPSSKSQAPSIKKKTLGKKSKNSDDDDDDDDDDDEDDNEFDDEDDDDDDDEEWDSDSSSSSSEEDEDFKKLTGRAKWLKRKVVTKTAAQIEAERAKAAQEREARSRALRDEKEKRKLELESAVTDKQAQVMSPEVIKTSILQTVSQLWRRDGSRPSLIRKLRALTSRALAVGPKHSIPALMQLISAQLQSNRGIDDHLPADEWRQVCVDMRHVLSILAQNPALKLVQDDPSVVETALALMDGNAENPTSSATVVTSNSSNPEDENNVYVFGDLAVHVGRLVDEHSKHLRNIDPHTHEYIARLGDEGTLLDLAMKVQELKEKEGDTYGASQLALIGIEHAYYLHDSIAKPVLQAQARAKILGDASMYHPGSLMASSSTGVHNHPASWVGSPNSGRFDSEAFDVGQFIDSRCSYIYEHGDDRAKVRAMLCQIYHHALHDRFYKARDLLLMSHLQDTVHNADVPTQILFNRMMVQVGMCAFRVGFIWDAHNCLSEVCAGGRARDLLAQGLSNRNNRFERDLENERILRRRLVPFHMHTNLELLECVHLTCAMLLEIPNMAMYPNNDSQVISQHFRKLMEQHERQIFIGPPENSRDTVLAAARALQEGDWKEATTLMLEKCTIWNLFPNHQIIHEMLTKKIKEEALRTFLLRYCSHYDSIRQDLLCSLFELSPSDIQSLTTKMIMSNSLKASWDQPSQTLVLHKIEPTKLQGLALQYSEGVARFVEINERSLDKLTGVYRFKDDGEQRRPRRDGRAGGRGDNNYRISGNNNSSSGGNYRSQGSRGGGGHRNGLNGRIGGRGGNRGGGSNRPRPQSFKP